VWIGEGSWKKLSERVFVGAVLGCFRGGIVGRDQ